MGPRIPCFCGGYPRHFCRHNDWARHPKYVAALGPRRTKTAGAHKSGERKPPGEQQTRRTNKTANKQVPPQPNTTNKTANKTTNKPANNKTANKTTNTAHISSLTRSTNLARGVQRTGLLSISGAAQQVAHKSAHLCPYIWADMGRYGQLYGQLRPYQKLLFFIGFIRFSKIWAYIGATIWATIWAELPI